MKKSLASLAKKSMQNMIITGALAILVLIFWALNPNFLGKYNIVSMAQSLAPYAIMGLGVTFVIATGGIDLSIGTTCIAAAVIAGKLYMNAYSAKIVPESAKIVVCDDFLEKAGKNDFCFCECAIATLENVTGIITYRWNRLYPADVHFGFDLEGEGFTLVSTEEFIGNSHATITEQIFKKER